MTRPWLRCRWNDAENFPGPTPVALRLWGIIVFVPVMLRELWWWGEFRPDIAYLIWHTRYWYDWTKPTERTDQ